MEKTEKIIIFSRHSLRYPSYIIPGFSIFKSRLFNRHKSKLSIYGKRLEKSKGRAFKKYLDGLEFRLDANNTEFFSTSVQRNLVSAESFVNGFGKTEKYTVSTEIDGISADDVFGSILNFKNDFEREGLQTEINSHFDYFELYQKDKAILCDIIGKKVSSRVLNSDKNEVFLHNNMGPEIRGDLHSASLCADSLIHLHLNFPFILSKLVSLQWQALSRICDMHREFIFGNTTIASRSAKPIAKVLSNNITDNKKRLTCYFCHDVNIFCLMKLLGLKYDKTFISDFGSFPSGCMLVIRVFANEQDEKKVRFNMMYPEDRQLLKHKKYSRHYKFCFAELKLEEFNESTLAFDSFRNLLNKKVLDD